MLNWQKAKSELKKEEDKLKETVLVVDDEEPNLRQLEAMLSRIYRVITAKDGKEALDLLNAPGIATIISDQRMPGMSGIEFFVEAEKRQHPATRLILTGFAELGSVVEAINSGGVFRYLTKPIVEEDLLSAVKQGVDHFNLSQVNLRLMGMLKDIMEDNAQMAKQINRDGDDSGRRGNPLMIQKPKKMSLAVLFTDIRGFTKLTSNLEADRVMEILQVVYRDIHRIIYECGGSVDKHLGDGLMAVFGLGGEAAVHSSVHCMKKVVEAYPALVPEIARLGGGELKLGAGLAAGEVVMGMLGTEHRGELAIIGQPANLASRLQEVTKLALQSPAARERFGAFQHAMGVTLPDISAGMQGFRTVELTQDAPIRDFHEINRVSVISS